METIKYELAKRLNESGVLDDMETEYTFVEGKYKAGDNKWYTGDPLKITCSFNIPPMIEDYKEKFDEFDLKFTKTLTLEEAIEFLPTYIQGAGLKLGKSERYGIKKYWVSYKSSPYSGIEKEGKTLLEAIEKMLEYLLDNKLLGKKKNLEN